MLHIQNTLIEYFESTIARTFYEYCIMEDRNEQVKSLFRHKGYNHFRNWDIRKLIFLCSYFNGTVFGSLSFNQFKLEYNNNDDPDIQPNSQSH